MSFANLGLSEKVLSAVETAGYTTPTPIQEKAIPLVLELKDLIGIAQTGTGKTAAFVLPMLTRLENGRARARMPRTLILEPTRELAAQVEENFLMCGINHKLNVALLIGGVSFDEQIKKLDRGVDVLIATPGRLLDLFGRGRLLMSGVEIIVIDEADRMLDMGFIPDIEKICKLIPPSRQTLMFSATMPPEIQRLADMFLTNPVRIEVAKPASTAETVSQNLVASGREAHDKRDVLRRMLRSAEDLKNGIIFCNRKRDVQVLYRSLEKHGFSVGALHGDMDQRARMATLDAFRGNRLTLLVASDVAARGLDIPDVSHVYNYDVPVHSEDYVHRIGRTGRAGRSGVAVTIVTDLDVKHLAAIQKLTGDKIAWIGPTISEMPEEERRGHPRSGEGRERSGRGGDKRRGGGRGEASASPSEACARKPRGGERGEKRAASSEGRREASSEGRREASAEGGRDRRRNNRPHEDLAPVRAGDRPAPRPRNDEVDEAPIGLGDHVPAFLLRPVRSVRGAE
ncbi:MAG: DEAD/DEAH box helicase [Phyllobacteriaceae bacterium]|nr:DEAD/DEAH box helicase [Phyllobacteriaceae bacterium]